MRFGRSEVSSFVERVAKNNIVQVPGPKRWLSLGVSLTHLVENSDLSFLKAEIVENIFQLDVLKNTRQIKSYDGLFQAMIRFDRS